jgi:hypothetical protein
MYIIKRFAHRHSSPIHFLILNSTQNKIKNYNKDFLGGRPLLDNPLNECISSRTKNINRFDIKEYDNPLNECISSRTKNIKNYYKENYQNPLNECVKEK